MTRFYGFLRYITCNKTKTAQKVFKHREHKELF